MDDFWRNKRYFIKSKSSFFFCLRRHRVQLFFRTSGLFCFFFFTASFSLGQGGWLINSAKAPVDLVAVYFTSADKGWVAGDDGYLASTVNGGFLSSWVGGFASSWVGGFVSSWVGGLAGWWVRCFVGCSLWHFWFCNSSLQLLIVVMIRAEGT